ncbi:hypothetical protein HNQ51_000210 [Inhella inkyongensis]|uniref:Histidine kinase n=1 Tax=Inhella inkyongensis TaxID=392593 RepID=A0A840RW66_9BURK|nr:histidine kinase [Inhella inkyongensis]MBB5202917.1 hypothetical protein [Inhella inkyongensis]
MNSSTVPTVAPRSLAEGNRFQRAYFRWAQPYYAKMSPDVREQVEAIDRHLYSRQGLGTWLGIAGGLGGATLGLHANGMGWGMALLLSLLVGFVFLSLVINLWMQPEKIAKSFGSIKRVGWMLALGMAGALFGTVFGFWAKRGQFDWLAYQSQMTNKIASFLPGVAVGMLGSFLVLWSLAQVRTRVLQRQRDQARLVGERDAATAQARQAQLQLLQAQIQPHFIFNTLAALQHWVDRSDPRAGPLLRQVSAFLRAATEMLGKDSVSLVEELAQVEHYLGIMKARWGERLRFELGCAPELHPLSLPPGLVLTLVENAVEHGLSHQLDGGQVWVEAGLNAAGQVQIQVRDDGAGLAPQWQAGVGLANVRERLQHHFGPDADLTLQPRDGGGCVATLSFSR